MENVAHPPPLPNAAPRRAKSTVGLWIAIVLLAVALGLSLMLNAGLTVGRLAEFGGKRAGDTPEDEFPSFQEKTSYGSGGTKVVRIAVEGVLSRNIETGWFGIARDPVGDVLRQIRAAQNDEEVGALIVEVDSPGGEVTPTDEIHNALREFRESREDRRVVVFVRGMAASGGYYIAAAADRIVAEPTAIVGSISVILQSLNWHGLSERVGVTATTIASGRLKDMLNPFKPVNPEHIAILQRVVDDVHERFSKVVAEGRGLDETAVAEVADGRIFSVTDALEKKLVDRVGFWDDAVEVLSELVEDDVRVVRYTRSPRFSDWLAQLRAPVDLSGMAPLGRGPRLWMLWQP